MLLSLLKYLSSNTSFKPFIDLSKHSIGVFLPIETYSFTMSAEDPYANIQIAEMKFCYGEKAIYQLHYPSFGNVRHDFPWCLKLEETHAYVF